MRPHNDPQNQEDKPAADKNQENLDMHSSKDAHESQGGQGAPAKDNEKADGKNTNHDKNNERSIAGREDS